MTHGGLDPQPLRDCITDRVHHTTVEDGVLLQLWQLIDTCQLSRVNSTALLRFTYKLAMYQGVDPALRLPKDPRTLRKGIDRINKETLSFSEQYVTG